MQKTSNGQVHFLPMFFPFRLSFFSPFILLPFFFFSFEVLLFDFPCVFPFFCIFASLKIIRTSYWGEHKANFIADLSFLFCRLHPLWRSRFGRENRAERLVCPKHAQGQTSQSRQSQWPADWYGSCLSTIGNLLKCHSCFPLLKAKRSNQVWQGILS